jgi:phosphoglycolate phosphatase-like HAD superfamily hydrolase
VLWDIDGTLLSTERAGIPAFEEAVRRVLGDKVDLTSLHTSGLTDRMIARRLFTLLGHEPDPEREQLLLDVYGSCLPRHLARRQGRLMPNVSEVLSALAESGCVAQGLLTGNIRAGAAAKLAVHDLTDRFTFGAFADDGFDRVEIGRVALRRAAEKVGDLDLSRVFLVGDTPLDIACGAALGIRTVAVATGVYTVRELAATAPWLLLEQLPAPEELFAELGLPVGVGG